MPFLNLNLIRKSTIAMVLVGGAAAKTLYTYSEEDLSQSKHADRSDSGWKKTKELDEKVNRIEEKTIKAGHRVYLCLWTKTQFELNPLLPKEYRIEQSTVDYHCRKAIAKIKKVIKKGDEIKGSL